MSSRARYRFFVFMKLNIARLYPRETIVIKNIHGRMIIGQNNVKYDSDTYLRRIFFLNTILMTGMSQFLVYLVIASLMNNPSFYREKIEKT